jgi:hypothetical protein
MYRNLSSRVTHLNMQTPASHLLGAAGGSGVSYLLNPSPPLDRSPSIPVRSETSPAFSGSALQSGKNPDNLSRAQASPKVLKTICDTITSNLDHWHLALNFTPNMRGRTKCRIELAALVSSNEGFNLTEKTLLSWMLSIKALGEQGISEEMLEASTGGSTETGNDSKPVDELKDACVALIKTYNAGIASGRFTQKGKDARRFPSPAQLGAPPAPGVTSPPQLVDDSSPSAAVSPAATGKTVRDAGVVTVSERKRQSEQAGEEDGAHRYPKKGGMGALNELAVNFGAYINQLVAKDQKPEGSLKETIENLKELNALREKAKTPREESIYTKKIEKLLVAMDSDCDE